MDFGRTPPTHVAEKRPSSIPLDALLALTREGFAYIGSDAHVLAWNAPAADLTGLSPEKVLNRDVRSVLVEGSAIVAVPFDGTARKMRLGVDTPTGVRWLAAAVVGIDAESHSHGWLCSFGPERRHREIEQLKNEIVAAVSHELKTPIATIKAYAETLRDNSVSVAAARDEYLRVIDEQADRLTRAVDDLLLASRVDADQLLNERVNVPLDEAIDAALAAVPFDFEAHPITRETAGVTLSGDRELLREILRHLIDNAAKYSPSGSPILIAGRNHDGATIVDVSDCGIGIEEEHLPYVFERFYRVEHLLTSESSGAGLGLFIVSALVRAHGGTISVASDPGKGSTFSIRLPVRA
jgi:two-component system, OmpR family, phosphate regulon sensor histidine kinase PhoR